MTRLFSVIVAGHTNCGGVAAAYDAAQGVDIKGEFILYPLSAGMRIRILWSFRFRAR